VSITLEIDCNPIFAADENKFPQNPLKRPPDRAAEKRVARQVRKPGRNVMPSARRYRLTNVP
jgi:hypothetical protein